MTTFQVIIDSVLRIASGIVPFSYSWAKSISEYYLNYTSSVELEYLITFVLCITLLLFFRYDWLGLLSAIIKTITQPTSIQKANRNLDQEVILYLASVSLPVYLVRNWFGPSIASVESLNSSIAYGIFFLIIALLIRFTYRWNKRIKGLNHLRTMDALPVILVSVFSIHPAFTLPMVFWVGMSLVNYHYEAIFKYSMLLLGVQTLIHFVELNSLTDFGAALASVGHLNAIAAMVVVFSIAWWMILENLQKNLSENTFRSWQWFHFLAALVSFAFFFLKG